MRDPAGVLTAALPRIERIVAYVGRRQGLPAHEVEELGGHVRLKLIEDDYSRLRAYGGRSSFGTYLLVCIQRLAHDLREKALGSWEPSAEARRIGPHAVWLENLWLRDRLSLDECERTLAPRFPTLTRKEIEEIAVRLPLKRVRRRQEGDETLENMAALTSEPDRRLEESEAFAIKREILAALRDELAALPAEDRLLVRLRMENGFKVSEIARSGAAGPGLDQKALYPRFERIFATLERGLLSRGVRPEEVEGVIRLGGRDEEET